MPYSAAAFDLCLLLTLLGAERTVCNRRAIRRCDHMLWCAFGWSLIGRKMKLYRSHPVITVRLLLLSTDTAGACQAHDRCHWSTTSMCLANCPAQVSHPSPFCVTFLGIPLRKLFVLCSILLVLPCATSLYFSRLSAAAENWPAWRPPLHNTTVFHSSLGHGPDCLDACETCNNKPMQPSMCMICGAPWSQAAEGAAEPHCLFGAGLECTAACSGGSGAAAATGKV